MNREDLSLKASSLLRRAGLSQVPTAAIASIAAICLILLLLGIWHFWPRPNPDFVAPSATGSMSKNSVDTETVNTLEEIKVDVEGAVINPGLYTMVSDARIGDAIEAAGGLASDAASGAINLAQLLSDGDQVYVPTEKEASEASMTAAAAGQAPSTTQQGATGKININTANAQELQQLDGIGPALSQRIVEHREAHGRFQSIDDLKRVPGIGEAKYAGIKDSICL